MPRPRCSQEKLEEKKHRLGTILEFYKVPAHIQKQVYAIYPYLLEATLSNTQEIAELPAYLQDQVYRHIKIDLLAQVPVFSGATRRAMAMLASTMTRILAPPMEYLTHEGEVSSCMFFLVQGVVQVPYLAPCFSVYTSASFAICTSTLVYTSTSTSTLTPTTTSAIRYPQKPLKSTSFSSLFLLEQVFTMHNAPITNTTPSVSSVSLGLNKVKVGQHPRIPSHTI